MRCMLLDHLLLTKLLIQQQQQQIPLLLQSPQHLLKHLKYLTLLPAALMHHQRQFQQQQQHQAAGQLGQRKQQQNQHQRLPGCSNRGVCLLVGRQVTARMAAAAAGASCEAATRGGILTTAAGIQDTRVIGTDYTLAIVTAEAPDAASGAGAGRTAGVGPAGARALAEAGVLIGQ